MAKVLHMDKLPIRQAAWYPKTEATFSDALAAVRRDLWSGLNYGISFSDDDMLLIPRQTVLSLLNIACYST